MTKRTDEANDHQLDAQEAYIYDKQLLERLLEKGGLDASKADAAASLLSVYPSKRAWVVFLDKALLIFGAMALALALVFFIAYNWITLGTLGKFALVEGALALSIVGYTVLAFKSKFLFLQKLLLLVASIVTGSLLALFGQVYQTGADTWQLFFNWALLIAPWVLIARLPALWLLWLGLINLSFAMFTDLTGGIFIHHWGIDRFGYLVVLFVFNFIALVIWMACVDRSAVSALSPFSAARSKPYSKTDSESDSKPSAKPSSEIEADESANETPSMSDDVPLTATSQQRHQQSQPQTHQQYQPPPPVTKLQLHWSTYLVGLVVTYFATRLTIYAVFNGDVIYAMVSILMWAIYGLFFYWRFRKQHIDLLMLTYLCGSAIIVVMFWAVDFVFSGLDVGGLFILTLLLIGMSSAAITWLNKLRKLSNMTSSAQSRTQNDMDATSPSRQPSEPPPLPDPKRGKKDV